MSTVLSIIQIVISAALITLVLLQQRGTGGGGIFGMGGGAAYHTKRGLEKMIFIATIVLAAAFIITAFLSLLI